MSILKLMAAGGGLALALAYAPVSPLHAQVTPGQDSGSRRTWRVNPGPTAPAAQARPEVLADSAFIREATSGNLLEVRLGRLAQQKAAASAVRQFAQRMVTDHTAMGNQWGTLAARFALPVKGNLEPAQEQAVTRLGTFSGAEFDRAYMTAMVEDHQHDVNAFQRLGLSAHSAEVRQLAASGLATIQQHLSTARQLRTELGRTAVAAAPLSPKGGPDELKADRKFVREVAADHLMEVRLGQMAQRKATRSEVRRFADHLVSDFTTWQDRWTEMASKHGMPFHPGLGPRHQEKLNRLQKASGAEFDRTYLAIVMENLQSLLPYFQKEGRAARSSPVRNLVEEELPILRQHLEAARQLRSRADAHADVRGRARDHSDKQ